MSKKIKRKIGETPKESNYFNDETDEAIQKYQKSNNEIEKDFLYTQYISPALNSLVNNLIWVYGFKSPRDSIDSMKSDCVSFLYENLKKWDPLRGTKAFSYYNITAKRWLINQARKYSKDDKSQVSEEETDQLNSQEQFILESLNYIESPDEVVSPDELRHVINNILNELDKSLIKNENEKKIIEAIKYLFNNIDSIDIINKRSILVYLREISGLNSNKLSLGLNSLRVKYKKVTGGNGIMAKDW